MHGKIFDIDNKKFFTFGGAKSHDIQDGRLNLDEEEKIYAYRKRRAFFIEIDCNKSIKRIR